MPEPDALNLLWQQTRERLAAKQLLADGAAALSLRCPGTTRFWLGAADASAPSLLDWTRPPADPAGALHARLYANRGDAGAAAWAGGRFATALGDFGGVLPQVFDEQARHLGPMHAPLADASPALDAALAGGGNVRYLGARALCLGITARRMALNLELLEKCATAYVLAAATGMPVRELPWWVKRIANARLRKDQARAQAAFVQGTLPIESKAY